MFGFGITILVIGVGLLIWLIGRINQDKVRVGEAVEKDALTGKARKGEKPAETKAQKEALKGSMRIGLAIVAVVVMAGGIVSAYVGYNSESFLRWQKDIKSNYEGGLDRRITVIDKDGEVLREYEGRMDIQSTDGDKLVFVMEGKKYIIYNRSIFNTIFVEEL